MKEEPKLTPSMGRYCSLKLEYPDGLMLYQIGDFYELFFDDAAKASEVLGIALTRKKQSNYEDIPMCGVPVHSVDSHIRRLVDSGFSIVLCQQMETPEEAKKKRGSTAVINREVVRIITPGTLTEDNMLEPKANNFLACIARYNKKYSLAWADISTGDFFCIDTAFDSFANCIALASPKEILLSDEMLDLDGVRDLLKKEGICVTTYPESFFEYKKSLASVLRFFETSTASGFGNLQESDISACGALLEYIALTNVSVKPRLVIPKKCSMSNHVFIDHSALKSLEIFKKASGEKVGSLIHAINRTLTACGNRMLASLLHAPIFDEKVINDRLDVVELFIGNDSFCQNIRKLLGKIPDFERSISRISMNRATPKDIECIAMTADSVLELSAMLLPKLQNHILNKIYEDLGQFEDLSCVLGSAIVQNFTGNMKDGGFVLSAYSEKLDKLRSMQNNSSHIISNLRTSYQNTTGISSLKILKNNIVGFYIEVPSNCILDGAKFYHKQTMANCIRYTTLELKELENEILSSEAMAVSLEFEIFKEVCAKIIAFAERFKVSAVAIAELDLIASFAVLATERKYVRPIVDNSTNFIIKLGRHPIIEQSSSFVANDLSLDSEKFIGLMTGPNMAGKSTFLRQNAIIAILSHIGSFVPADYAHIGLIDKIFSRVGASDDISMGYSTFMMEMVEVASIVNQATSRSFVIIDEIGRGTAVYDGLSIAWSVVEYIHNVNKSRSLFSTHYHDLAKLNKSLSGVKCLCIKVEEWNDEVVFLYSVMDGVSSKSYGINVAKMAGIPSEIIDRSRCVMEQFLSTAN